MAMTLQIEEHNEDILDLTFLVWKAYEILSTVEDSAPVIKSIYQLVRGEWLIAATYFLEVNADVYKITEECLKTLDTDLALYSLDYPTLEQVIYHLDGLNLFYEMDNEYKNGALVTVW